MGDSGEDRLIRLSDVIRTSIDEMMSDKMAQQFQKKRLSPTAFANRLLTVLDIGLKCEREQYIKELQTKITKLENEKSQLLNELANEKRRFAHENSIISTDKAVLQRRYDTLDEHYKALGWRKDQKEMTYNQGLQMRDNIIRLQHIAIKQAHKSNIELRDELRDLRAAVASNNRKQVKFIHALKDILFDQFQTNLNYFLKKQKKKDTRELQILAKEFQVEKMQHDQLKGASQLLLDSIWTISPKHNKPPKCTLEELPRNLSEVNTFIQRSVQDQKDIAIENVKRELSLSLPEISIIGDETVTQAVSTVLSDRIAEKEAEFQSKIKAAEKREEKLRKKLQIAISQIQNMKKPTLSPPQYRYVDEYKEMKDDWDEQKEKLDMKMRELSEGMSRSLGSTLTSSIFNSP